MLEFYEKAKFCSNIKSEVEIIRETRKELSMLSKTKLRKDFDGGFKRQRAYTFSTSLVYNNNKSNYSSNSHFTNVNVNNKNDKNNNGNNGNNGNDSSSKEYGGLNFYNSKLKQTN